MRKEPARVHITTIRVGNVIGPGDWASDRIVPDAVRALMRGTPVPIRNPQSVRPWQHVLDPLSGYLWLGALLSGSSPEKFAGAWNFGPESGTAFTVRDLVENFIKIWTEGSWVSHHEELPVREAGSLQLAIDKASLLLDWQPVWGFPEAVRRTAEGYHELIRVGNDGAAVRRLMEQEIRDYTKDAVTLGLPWAMEET